MANPLNRAGPHRRDPGMSVKHIKNTSRLHNNLASPADRYPSSAVPEIPVNRTEFFPCNRVHRARPADGANERVAPSRSRFPDWLAPCKPRLNLILVNRASPISSCNQHLNISLRFAYFLFSFVVL